LRLLERTGSVLRWKKWAVSFIYIDLFRRMETNRRSEKLYKLSRPVLLKITKPPSYQAFDLIEQQKSLKTLLSKIRYTLSTTT
jgi:hypothetical protein